MKSILKSGHAYYFPLLSLASIIAGMLTGSLMGDQAAIFKPLGDIFLNLLLTAVVPLVFFSIASAVSHISGKKLIKLLFTMLLSFLFTGMVAAVYMLLVVTFFLPEQAISFHLSMPDKIEAVHLSDKIVHIFSVTDFSQLLNHQHMLPLIIFSLLIGFATASSREKGRVVAQFLQSGTIVMMEVITFIMYYAPVGFFAYFAVLAGKIGPALAVGYFWITVMYYVSALLYIIFAFTYYAWIAGGMERIKTFWKYILIPMLTALATCSSAASIPANLQAAKNMNIPPDVYETVIPLGAILHKDGSVLGGVLKIGFLFALFGIPFSGFSVFMTAIFIGLLVGMVMGAVPSGGMLGEMLILSLYGFPPQALMVIVAIGLIIDPLATLINVAGDIACSMLTERFIKKAEK